MVHDNLMGGPPETLLASDPATAPLAEGADVGAVTRANPTSSLGWAVLGEQALEAGRDLEAYAYGRTGYHRGLDALRRSGWKGHGPVPWAHEPNRGFLRALAVLAQAAAAIDETDEAERCRAFLADCDPEAARLLL